jgi:phage/plasmid-associated DNA primase
MQGELTELYGGEILSKIMILDKSSKFHSIEYGRIMEAVNAGTESDTGNLYNIITSKQVLIEDEIDNILDNTSKMIVSNHFLPVVEIPRDYSNFSCIVELTTPYKVNKFHQYCEDARDLISAICNKIYYSIVDKINEKTPTEICVFACARNKKIYLKFHMLRYLMNYSSKLFLLEKVKRFIAGAGDDATGCWMQRYNEIYETSAFPILSNLEHYYWNIISCYECRNKYSANVSVSDKTAFINKLKENSDWINVFSINDVKSDYEKKIIILKKSTTKQDPVSLDNQHKLLYMINKYPRLEFFNLIFSYLPEEFLKEPHLTNIVNSLKPEQHSELLAKMWYEKHSEGKFYKLWNNTHKASGLAYYYNIAKNDTKFVSEFNLFIGRLMERFSYDNKGKISDSDLSMLVNFMFYGKFFTFEKKVGNNYSLCKYMFVDKFDPIEEKFLYKWIPFDVPRCIYRFLTEDLKSLIQCTVNKIDTVGNVETRKMSDKDKSIKKMVKELEKLRTDMGNESRFRRITSMLNNEVYHQLFKDRIDITKDVIGVLNGVLHMDLGSDNPQPKLYTGYSPYVVTRSANAKYVPYEKIKGRSKYLHRIKNALRDIIPDKEARNKFVYILSTSLDEIALKDFIIIIIGWGGNGKSLILDWILEVLGESYGVKASPKLFTDSAQSGRADPELMAVKNSRMAYAAETSKGDCINSTRIKQITEKKKTGRELYGAIESFSSSPTYVISTNFPIKIEDRDNGTNRRLMCLNFPMRFVYKPDPENPYEKKIDTTLPSILADNPRACNELFSYLVHIRCKLQRKYKSNIHLVPSSLMDKDTNDYKCEQDILSRFISTRIVVLYGYNSRGRITPEEDKSEEEWLDELNKYYEDREVDFKTSITMESIVAQYILWAKRIMGEDIKGNFNELLKDFMLSNLSKFITGEGELSRANGVRVLDPGKDKVKGEVYVR